MSFSINEGWCFHEVNLCALIHPSSYMPVFKMSYDLISSLAKYLRKMIIKANRWTLSRLKDIPPIHLWADSGTYLKIGKWVIKKNKTKVYKIINSIAVFIKGEAFTFEGYWRKFCFIECLLCTFNEIWDNTGQTCKD